MCYKTSLNRISFAQQTGREIPFEAGPAIDPALFDTLRLRTIFKYHKWDAQVGDTDVLMPFPILLKAPDWQTLVDLAERLADETRRAEEELMDRPSLYQYLGLPRLLERRLTKLARSWHAPIHAIRVIRFDFHWTTEGWRLSEANTDVPGGFIEAGGFTRLVAEHYKNACAPPDPAQKIAEIMASSVPDSDVALIHATSYTDDRQVMMYVADQLEARGLHVYLGGPDDLAWSNDGAYIQMGRVNQAVRAIIRFFPADWLSRLRSFPVGLFANPNVLLVNPATAIFTQSKRFPLTWPMLETRLPTWQALLPETYDPRSLTRDEREDWVLKPAWGREGERLHLSGITPALESRSILAASERNPGGWVAQRRFDVVRIDVDGKSYYPCFGVYTVNGKAAGVYGRLGRRPLIDGDARETAVLIETGEPIYGND